MTPQAIFWAFIVAFAFTMSGFHMLTNDPRPINCRPGAVYYAPSHNGPSTFPTIAPQVGTRKFECRETEVYQVGPLDSQADFNKTKSVLTLVEVPNES
jgi:hypothetical protein